MDKRVSIVMLMLVALICLGSVNAISFTINTTQINMTDTTCGGKVNLSSNLNYNLTFCLTDSTKNISCIIENNIIFGNGSKSLFNINWNNMSNGTNYSIWISWKKIKYIEMNVSVLNGYNDTGQLKTDGDFGKYPDCSVSQGNSLGVCVGGSIGSDLYDACGCAGNHLPAGNSPICKSGYDSHRVAENYIPIGGSDANVGTIYHWINKWSVPLGKCCVMGGTCPDTDGCTFGNDFYSGLSCVAAGTKPTYANSLCTNYASQSYSSNFTYILNTPTYDLRFTDKIISNMTLSLDFITAQTINDSTGYESQLKTFLLILNKSSGLTTNANFTFNGTFYTPTKTTGTDYDTYSQSLYLPKVPTNLYVYNFSYLWNYSVTDGASTSVGYTLGKISTDRIILYACDNATLGNVTSLKFSNYKEEFTDTPLKADFLVETKYYLTDRSNYSSANFTLPDRYNFSLCLHPNFTQYADVYIKYNTSGGYTHRWYLYNYTINNISNNISIYNYDTTTGISELDLTVRNKQNYKYYPEIVAVLQRNYVGEGVWRTVQMSQTDSYGLAIFNIREKTTDYKILFYDINNNLISTTTSMKFSCVSSYCYITYMLNPLNAYETPQQLEASVSFNNVTKMMSVSWANTQGSTSSVQTVITKSAIPTSITICDLTSVGVSGTQTCNLTNFSGEVSVQVVGTTGGVTGLQFGKMIDIGSVKITDFIGQQEGYFWTFVIVVTCVMFGIFSPVGGIIAMIVGLIFCSVLGIGGAITNTVIIMISVIGVIIGMKVKS